VPRIEHGAHFGQLGLEDRAAGRVRDGEDQARRHLEATVGKRRVGASHFQERDLATTERQGQAIVGSRQRRDAQPAGHLHESGHANLLERVDRRDVPGRCQRVPQRYRAQELAIIVHRMVWPVGTVREVLFHVHQHGGRRVAVLEGGEVSQRLDR